jgi:hypothetical protein
MQKERQHHDLSNPQQFNQMHLCNGSAGPLYPAAKMGSCSEADFLLSGATRRGHGYNVLEFAQYVLNISRIYFQTLKSML